MACGNQHQQKISERSTDPASQEMLQKAHDEISRLYGIAMKRCNPSVDSVNWDYAAATVCRDHAV